MSLDFSYLQNIVIIDEPVINDNCKEQQDLTAQGIISSTYWFIALQNDAVNKVLTSPVLKSVVMNSIIFTCNLD